MSMATHEDLGHLGARLLAWVAYRLVQVALPAWLVFALCGPVFAQATCGPRGEITKNLTERFGEVYIGGGLQSGTQMVEVWTSPTTGSFTILLTRANGISCIALAGKHFGIFIPAPAPKGELR